MPHANSREEEGIALGGAFLLLQELRRNRLNGWRKGYEGHYLKKTVYVLEKCQL